jgi:dihydrofolate reductase
MTKLLHVIVACSENRVIGRDGKLPWSIPEDLAYFHAETAGQVCVLGRVCYETWPRVHADGRTPVVITSRPTVARPGAHAATDLSAALSQADALPGNVYICGGQRIYEETFALARQGLRRIRLHLTLVHAQVTGDTYFPEWRHLSWHELSRRDSADANYHYTFSTLDLV